MQALVAMKKISSRAQVITVMTAPKPQEEDEKTPYATPVKTPGTPSGASRSSRTTAVANPLNEATAAAAGANGGRSSFQPTSAARV
jgi:hypothetical protein